MLEYETMSFGFGYTYDVYKAEQLVQESIHAFRPELTRLLEGLNSKLDTHRLEEAVHNLIINPEFVTFFFYLRSYNPGVAIHHLVKQLFSKDLQDQRGVIQTMLNLLYPDDQFLVILEHSYNTPKESLEKVVIGIAEVLLSVLRPDVDLTTVTLHFKIFDHYCKMREALVYVGEYDVYDLMKLDILVEDVLEGQLSLVDFISSVKDLNIFSNPEVKLYLRQIERFMQIGYYDARHVLPRQIEIVNQIILLENNEAAFIVKPTTENAISWIGLLVENYRYKGQLTGVRMLMIYDRIAAALRSGLRNGFKKADKHTCNAVIECLTKASESFPELIDFDIFLKLIETSLIDGIYTLDRDSKTSNVVLGVLVLSRIERAQKELIDSVSDSSDFHALTKRMKDRLRLMLEQCKKVTDKNMRLFFARKILNLLTSDALHDSTLEEFIANDLNGLIDNVPKLKFGTLLPLETQVHRQVEKWINSEA